MSNTWTFTLIACLFLLAGCNSNTTFKPFFSREGGFSVEIPVLPTEKTSQMESPYGDLVEHDYFSVYDGVFYSVGYLRLPDDLYNELKRNPDRLSNLDISGLVSHAKGRLLGERGVSAAGLHNHGKEVLISLPDGQHNLVSRVYWSDRTLYLIHTIIPKQPAYNQDIYSTRFLESMRIIGSD